MTTCRHNSVRVVGNGAVYCQDCFTVLAELDLRQWWNCRQPAAIWPLVAAVAHEPPRALYVVRGTGPAHDAGLGTVLEGPEDSRLRLVDLDELPAGFRYVPLAELLDRRWELPIYEIEGINNACL